MDNYLKLSFIMNVNGYCGSGKSYFIQYLIKSLKSQLDCILVFSNTANFTEDYEFLKKLKITHFIFSSLEADNKMEAIMKIQKKNRVENKKKNVLLIFDDILGGMKDSKIFKCLITTYRHYNISIIFSTQYINAANTFLREISNYVIIFNQRTVNSLKIAYENYFNDEFDNFNSFKESFVKKLQNYNFYFINRVKNTKNIMCCPASI